MVKVIRDDEAGHRDVNHNFADILESRKIKKDAQNEIIEEKNKQEQTLKEEIK